MIMQFGGINLHNVRLEISAGLPSQLIKNEKPQIAFSGRSNVGKSSLVNCLINRKKMARVSSEPGKTITVNYYEIDGKLYFVDLPGYGYARRSAEEQKKWSSLTQLYFEKNDSIKTVLQLIDIKVGPTEDDLMMLDWLNYYNAPYLIVATKCDKLNKTELTEAVKNLTQIPIFNDNTEIILFSSKKNIGRDELLERILK